MLAGSFSTIIVPGATATIASGINSDGRIVGEYFAADGTLHGFLEQGGSYTTIDIPGAIYTSATGINDRGQIVGNFEDTTGVHGFVATPTPEPSNVLLFASGILGLAGLVGGKPKLLIRLQGIMERITDCLHCLS